MTPLQRAEALLEKITPGEWHYWHGDDTYFMNCYAVTSEKCTNKLIDEEVFYKKVIAITLLQQPRYATLEDNDGKEFQWADNAKFIAAAPALMRELVEENKNTEAERDKWFGQLIEQKNKTIEWADKCTLLTQQIEELKANEAITKRLLDKNNLEIIWNKNPKIGCLREIK